MNFLYGAIIALIANQFNSDYPLVNTDKFSGRYLFDGNQNNYTVPKDAPFVIVTAHPEANQILNPSSITDSESGTQRFITLFSSKFQVDFYGTNAQENARQFSLLLNSWYANNFWKQHELPCSVNRVDDVKNLTHTIGREMYMPRFMVECSLFNNGTSNTDLETYEDIINRLYYVY